MRAKLRAARLAAKSDQSYAVNVSALEKAQPKDLDASEIDVRLGATWLPAGIIQQFMEETFEPPFYLRRNIEVKFSEMTAEWQITRKSAPSRNDVHAYMTYGTGRANAYKILEDTLNLRDVRIYDTVEDADGRKRRVLNKKETTLAQQKQQAIKDAFRDWVWRDPYREKRKAKKIAENGGTAIQKKTCPCCGEEFTPTSNRQVFCTPNYRYVYAQNEKKAAREAERGDHYYRQRNCMVCGKLFWPTHSQQSMCSDECRKKHHNEVTLEAYHKKQAEKRNGGHPYPERQCEVCGRKFWPDGPSAKACSEDCRLEKKRIESRAAYARQRQEQGVQQVAV